MHTPISRKANVYPLTFTKNSLMCFSFWSASVNLQPLFWNPNEIPDQWIVNWKILNIFFVILWIENDRILINFSLQLTFKKCKISQFFNLTNFQILEEIKLFALFQRSGAFSNLSTLKKHFDETPQLIDSFTVHYETMAGD